MEFANKEYFALLLLIVPYILWYFLYRKHSEPTMRMSDTNVYRMAPKSWRIRIIHMPMFLRCVAFVLLVCILARPQTHNSWDNKQVEGIDIMLVMDVSTSMLAEDLKPNRMEAAKSVASEFISDRPNDNIGLTIFAGEAFTQCPMTTDHASLLNLLHTVRTDIASRGIIADGTAIGMGLANAVSRLKDSKAKSKVIILLTDGSNNMGDISPLTSAQIAKSFGIRVYTIGVGTNKVAPYPMPVAGGIQYVNIPVEIDTKTLASIAQTTDANFYRATNNRELLQIYKDIDKLEKTKMDVKRYSKRYEAYQPFALALLVINAVEAHHGDVEPESLIACLVQAADTISAARPGARKETLETYSNRLQQLEDITNSYKGVEKSFAVQAGREVRILVVPEQISDADMVLLARDISKQIETELEYPGQIKVNVIRESRVVDYAK